MIYVGRDSQICTPQEENSNKQIIPMKTLQTPKTHLNTRTNERGSNKKYK
jgi:hypothetical protein